MACAAFLSRRSWASGQPTASEHLRVLVHAQLIRAKRIKQWTFYKRDEQRIAQVKKDFGRSW